MGQVHPTIARLDHAESRSIMSSMDYRHIITIEPGKRSGKPCIRGMRITVGDVLDYLAGGMAIPEILADFPELTEEDIRACLAFAADRERKLAVVGLSCSLTRTCRHLWSRVCRICILAAPTSGWLGWRKPTTQRFGPTHRNMVWLSYRRIRISSREACSLDLHRKWFGFASGIARLCRLRNDCESTPPPCTLLRATEFRVCSFCRETPPTPAGGSA